MHSIISWTEIYHFQCMIRTTLSGQQSNCTLNNTGTLPTQKASLNQDESMVQVRGLKDEPRLPSPALCRALPARGRARGLRSSLLCLCRIVLILLPPARPKHAWGNCC